MKIIKNILKNSRLVRSVAVLMMLCAVNTFSMWMTEMGQKAGRMKIMQLQLKMQAWQAQQQLQRERAAQYQPGKYFIYQEGTSNGILVDQALAKKFSSIKAMVEDMSSEPDEIPVKEPIDTIKLAFGIVANTIDVHYLSLEDLVSVANVFNYLDAPHDIFTIVVENIKMAIKMTINNGKRMVSINNALKKLNFDVQKLLMVDPAINCLKDLIIKKYAKDRKQVLVGYSSDGGVNSVTLSRDGKKIAAHYKFSGQNNFIIWDISDPYAITDQSVVGLPADFASVSPKINDKRGITVSIAGHNVLLHDRKHDTYQYLKGHSSSVNAVALSADGNKLVSGSLRYQDNLILWDISDLSHITHQSLVWHPLHVIAVALSADGNRLISGSWGDQNNLILWDISNTQAITHQSLVGHSDKVNAVALSGDGNKLVSGGGFDDKNELIVWTLVTDQEQLILNQLKNYNADQVRLVYLLSLQASKGNSVTLQPGSEEEAIFMTLPHDMQGLLTDLVLYKGWFSVWW